MPGSHRSLNYSFRCNVAPETQPVVLAGKPFQLREDSGVAECRMKPLPGPVTKRVPKIRVVVVPFGSDAALDDARQSDGGNVRGRADLLREAPCGERPRQETAGRTADQ